MFYYMAANVRGTAIEYEPLRIPVIVDGKPCIYKPDFRICGTDHFIEIKGTHRWITLGMKKVKSAIEQGYEIEVVRVKQLAQYCGVSEKKMQKLYATGGAAAVERLIADSISMLSTTST